MKRIIYFLIFALLVSCNKEKVDLPPLLENIIPSKSEMPFNLVSSENEFPDKIKKFYQLQNTDTLNILEFDNHKNLIFKYYKQYVGNFWKDKFIYMIEANVYNGNKIIKTYYLHSNAGYELFTYDYYGDNIQEMKSYFIGNIKGSNTNSCYFIKQIKSYKDSMDFIKKIENENKNRFNYKITREFSGNKIIESFDSELQDGTYKLIVLNKKNKIEKIEYYAKDKKWDNSTKYFEYDNLNNLTKTYSINKHSDTLKSTEYRIKNSNKIVIKKENEIEISRKEFLKNTVIKYDYKAADSSYYGVENYLLDKYGVPQKILENNQGIDTCYNLKNYYQFYK